MLRQVKNIILFLFTNFYITAYNQVIRGTVFDAEIKSSIPFATVYFNGTFVGTTSDQDGIFKRMGISIHRAYNGKARWLKNG